MIIVILCDEFEHQLKLIRITTTQKHLKHDNDHKEESCYVMIQHIYWDANFYNQCSLFNEENAGS